MWMDMVRLLLALAFIFAGAGLLFLLLTRHTNSRSAGSSRHIAARRAGSLPRRKP